MSGLLWDKPTCSNCMLCAVVCAERHTGMSAPARAHIRLMVNTLDGSYAAEYCRQCPDALCAAACPAEAFWLDEEFGTWRIDEALCIGCGECVEACRYNAVQLDPITGLAAKCDLCLGAVRCAEICPTEALRITDLEAPPMAVRGGVD